MAFNTFSTTRGQPISSDRWDEVGAVVDWLCEHWDQPDEGVWETRAGRRNFVYSRLMCWVALERAIRLANRRGLPADLPRWQASRDAIYRYDPATSPDGLHGPEGTFSICSFWYVEAMARAGRLEEARLAFEKMLTYANHLGLFAEEIGPTGEQLGNFPQAFTHLSLISAAFNLDRALG